MDLVRSEAKQLVFDHLAQSAQPKPAGSPGLKRRPFASPSLSAAT